MATITAARLALAPSLLATPVIGEGTIDAGLPASYNLPLDDGDWTYAAVIYRGTDTLDISTSSVFTSFTFTDVLGDPFTSPAGVEFLRIQVERVESSPAPDPAYPVAIVLTGPGLPSLAQDVMAPYDVCFYQPYVAGFTTALSGSSHLNILVPSANAASLRFTLTLYLRKAA